MIFKQATVLIAVVVAVMAGSVKADPLCGLSGFEKVSSGWLSKYSRADGVWVFKTNAKALEVMPSVATPLSSLARLSAIKHFANRYKKIYPPSDENAQWIIKGLLVRTGICAGEQWVQYSIELHQMSWETSGVSSTADISPVVRPAATFNVPQASSIVD